MPRQARKASSIGIYHVMLRGINRQLIFEDEEDQEKFLQILEEYKTVSGYKIYAYCLMGNHLHLLIKEIEESLEQIFKRICSKYVYWYNTKYQRVGHLFQDRYKSEPIEDEQYLFAVLRYIHQNPLKAKLCKRLEDYRFSSYNSYFLNSKLVDSSDIYDMIGQEEFRRFNNEINDDKCLEMEDQPRLRFTDEQAEKIIKRLAKSENISQIQQMNIKNRNSLIKKLKVKGISIRQINRLTGISKGIIERV